MDSSEVPNTSSLLQNLPRDSWGSTYEYLQWEGFWYRQQFLVAAIAAQSNFRARDDDVILASSVKTGTTWLKAIIPSIINHKANPADCSDHHDYDPFVENHPNSLMPSFEVQIFRKDPKADLSDLPSPRLFRTHVPYAMLAESIKNSGCKIVYITRDPKDVIVSLWHFLSTNMTSEEQELFSFNDAFEKFCSGIHAFGPFHDHVLGYWKESQKKPEKVHFMKYEELKRDPVVQVQKLASFLGRSLMNEEVENILCKCSFDRLKNLEVNKHGVDPDAGMAYKSYFRLGIVGDWRNHLSVEMQKRLDDITLQKLKGSGLDL